jgi:stage III sporulation protein AG
MEEGKASDREKGSAILQGLLKNKQMTWVLAALGIGVVALLDPLSWMQGSPTPQPMPSVTQKEVVNTERSAMSQYEAAYETRLTEILNTVRGVSDVKVMVNIDSSEEILYAEDVQENRQTTSEDAKGGGTRTITQVDKSGKLVMVKQGGTDQPVVIKTIKPRVRGVIVTAQGAEELKVQALIMEAVQRALDVPPHKISILPKKL